LLLLINKGIRKMEAFIIALVLVIGVSFIFEMILPAATRGCNAGLIPTMPSEAALYTCHWYYWTTVMPHNLYYTPPCKPENSIDRRN
jgi:manganese transport protein